MSDGVATRDLFPQGKAFIPAELIHEPLDTAINPIGGVSVEEYKSHSGSAGYRGTGSAGGGGSSGGGGMYTIISILPIGPIIGPS